LSSSAAVIFLLIKRKADCAQLYTWVKFMSVSHVCNGNDKLVKCTFVNKNVKISPIKFEKIYSKSVMLTDPRYVVRFLKFTVLKIELQFYLNYIFKNHVFIMRFEIVIFSYSTF
jgi:hypothetical protein